MSETDIEISEAGYVYARIRPRSRRQSRVVAGKRLLGHISELLNEQSPRAKLIRRWWQRHLGRIGLGSHTVH